MNPTNLPQSAAAPTWEIVSDGRLHASTLVHGMTLHLTALRVKDGPEGQQAYDEDEDASDLDTLYELGAPGEPFQAGPIPGHEGEWIVFGTPGS